ncbi:MAG: hypothetical protein RIT27_594 [Pseudomonadota bacterium]|jgi:hypothetical protein
MKTLLFNFSGRDYLKLLTALLMIFEFIALCGLVIVYPKLLGLGQFFFDSMGNLLFEQFLIWLQQWFNHYFM